LPTESYKCAFEFVEVIIWNIVSFFTSDTVKWHFDDVIITSALLSDKQILKANFACF